MGRNTLTKRFNEFLEQNIIARCSRYISRRGAFADWFYRTIRKFLKKPEFAKRNAN